MQCENKLCYEILAHSYRISSEIYHLKNQTFPKYILQTQFKFCFCTYFVI